MFDDAFSNCFGFTEEEVRGMLATFGHPEKIDEAKGWYDGYRFGGSEIYNPWSLLNYVDDGFTPKAYWLSTSSNDLVGDVLSRLSPEMRDTVANLFEKKEGNATLSPDLGPYGLIQDNEEILWSLLVHTGYLKVTSGPDANGTATLAFPNREVARVFRDDILARMKSQPLGQFVGRLTRALSSGDAERFRKSLEDFLVASASYFDTAKEDFFHGQIANLLSARSHAVVSFGFYVMPVLILLAGLVVLVNPFAAAAIPFIILGVSSTVYGITELINIYKFRKKEEKVMATEVVIEDVTPIEE